MATDRTAIEELRNRIQTLSQQQMKAIQDAVYLGMTEEVATDCQARRELISELIDKLAGLCK